MGKETLTPIFCVHGGNRFYLPYIIAQVKDSNPNTPFYFLSDRSTAYYRGIEHVCYEDYFSKAREFEKVYKHHYLDGTRYTTELFCFQRWLILDEFVHKMGFERGFIIDSDVMVYANVERLKALYKDFDMSIMYLNEESSHGGSCFFNKASILGKLSDVIFDMYTAEKSTHLLQDLFSKKTIGGVTDMDALHIFKKRYSNLITTGSIPINNLAQDSGILQDDRYEQEGDRSKVFWKNKTPFFKNLSDGAFVEMAIIHLQGHSKNTIQKYLQLRTFRAKSLFVFNWLAFKLLKYPMRWWLKLKKQRHKI